MVGIGEDLSLPGRLSVRVPMRWSSGWNAGFRAAPSRRLVRPVRESSQRDGNVWDQSRDPDSLLNWTKAALAARREAGLVGGAAASLDAGDNAVFAHRWDAGGRSLIALHNLSGLPRDVALDLASEGRGPSELFADRRYAVPTDGQVAFTLAPYGFRWFVLERAARPAAAATG